MSVNKIITIFAIKKCSMKEPLVSVGIPVYNVELYIEKCLLSVFEQTYQNLEILIIRFL